MRNNFRGWNAINIVPFFLSMIIRIRVVITKIQILQRRWLDNPSLCGKGLFADGKSGYLTVCLDLEVIPVVCEAKVTIRCVVFRLPPNHGNGKKTFDTNHLPIR
jgi:hypothetical protein